MVKTEIEAFTTEEIMKLESEWCVQEQEHAHRLEN